jgi:MFS family permease
MRLFGFESLKLSPVVMLVFISLINCMSVIERVGFSSLIPTLEKDAEIRLSGSQVGTIASGFSLFAMIASPIYAYLSQTIHPFTLIGATLAASSLSLLIIGAYKSFMNILLFRMVLGVGSGCLNAFSAPIILIIAPSSQKNKWISIFFITQAAVSIFAYAYASFIKNTLKSWIYVYIIDAIVYIPFIFIAFVMHKDPSLLFKKQETTLTIFQQFKLLSKNLTYVNLVLGKSSIVFALGPLAFWGPTVLQKLYKKSEFVSLLSLGIINTGCGIISFIIGAKLFDMVINKYRLQFENNQISSKQFDHIKTEKGSKLLFILIIIGFIFVVLGPAIAPSLGEPIWEFPFAFYIVSIALGLLFLLM